MSTLPDERYLITAVSTLRDALARINSLSGGEMTLFVIDSHDSRRIVGTLTDGDIRRALLAGITLDSPVNAAMFTDFKRLVDDDSDRVDTIRDIRRRGISLVPVVDTEGRLVRIVDLNLQPTRLPLSAILMAGGKGERLRPLTLTTPKPLLLIDGKPIIDYNIDALLRAGITDITVTTRYLADQIHAHFAAPVAPGVTVRCVTETSPLGTIGSAALVPHPKGGSTLVMNSDLLTTASFEDMYIKHRDSRADITIGVIPYQVSVPYAILATDADGLVTGIEEKPAYSYYANAGIYIFANELLDSLPADRRTDATDLIEQAIADGRRVVYHIINGTWIDVGSPTDFRQAEELMRHHRNLSAR